MKVVDGENKKERKRERSWMEEEREGGGETRETQVQGTDEERGFHINFTSNLRGICLKLVSLGTVDTRHHTRRKNH